MAEIINLSDSLPHCCIHTPDGNAHVLPVEVIKKISDGRLSVDDIDCKEQIVMAVFGEWLRTIDGYS